MRRPWTPLLLTGLWAGVACSDGPSAPKAPLFTILAYYAPTGENVLIHSDGEAVGSLGGATVNMIPVGAYTTDGTIVLRNGDALVLTTLSHPETVDTVIDPAPTSQSLVSFAPEGRYLALIAVAPDSALFLYDRANHTVDTLSMGSADPGATWPPVFSPDGRRIALITVTALSIQVTIIQPGTQALPSTATLNVSRFVNRPLYGWPRWTDDGILMAFRRVADQGPDTLVVGVVQPDDPNVFFEERYRAVLAPVSDQQPEITFGPSSTYSLSADGSAVVLAALPSLGATTHSLYVVFSNLPRVQIVEDGPNTQLFFPQFIEY